MSQAALLGTAYRVSYIAKKFESGLTDITAQVIKPNGSVIGVFSLFEFDSAAFKGMYYFDLSTDVSDPEGEYIGLIHSPSEDLKTGFKVTFRPASDSSFKQPSLEDSHLKGVLLDAPPLKGFILNSGKITGIVSASKLKGSVSTQTQISGKIHNNSITGVLSDKSFLRGILKECKGD
jgi:hypothetical protein